MEIGNTHCLIGSKLTHTGKQIEINKHLSNYLYPIVIMEAYSNLPLQTNFWWRPGYTVRIWYWVVNKVLQHFGYFSFKTLFWNFFENFFIDLVSIETLIHFYKNSKFYNVNKNFFPVILEMFTLMALFSKILKSTIRLSKIQTNFVEL
jgi:hypothetical protein